MFSVESLERAIEQAKKNIKVFEAAIDREYAQIKEWRYMIEQIDRKNSERNAVKRMEGTSNDGENRCNT